MSSLRSQWPWNEGFLNLMLWVPIFIGALAIAAAYPFAGNEALWFLTIPLAGFLFRAMFAGIGKQVETLRRESRGKAGEKAEGLIVIGNLQSPGIIIKNDENIELIPIAGRPFTAPIDRLSVFREGRLLPGKFVWGKRAFIFLPVDGTKVAFAVAEKTGAKWSAAFRTAPDGKRRPLAQQPPGGPDPLARQQSTGGQQ